MATGILSVISALLGYTAIALESRCLLASVCDDDGNDDVSVMMTKMRMSDDGDNLLIMALWLHCHCTGE